MITITVVKVLWDKMLKIIGKFVSCSGLHIS
jgi:hypothetical protein